MKKKFLFPIIMAVIYGIGTFLYGYHPHFGMVLLGNYIAVTALCLCAFLIGMVLDL